MKIRAVMLAMLLPGLAASAQEAPGQSNDVENVIVTAPKERPEKTLDNFIIAHALPSPGLGKIGRWKSDICPVTLGLPPKFDQFVTRRIVQVAAMVGAPLDASEPCRPNVTVLATDQPQELMDLIRTKHGALLGYHYLWQARDIATVRRPIQSWYSTATEDFWGIIQADEPGLYLRRILPKDPGMPSVVHVSGFRDMDGLKSRFATAMIIVDTRKIAGQEIGAVADYIAMLALSQAKSYDVCQDVPSITNLFADCGTRPKPAGLTDIDVAYLRGLYRMNAGVNFIGERGSIAYEMKKVLGGY